MRKNKSTLWVQFIFLLALTFGLVYVLNTKIGDIPPVGKFLDPARGVWQTALIPDIPDGETIRIPGLKGDVTITYNERGVPHIFAQNDHDLYLAQGYVVARHRLWQMEFSTHAAAGRVSEIVGERALNYDRYQRKIGMTFGAEQTYAEILKDEWSTMAVQAYSDGVNTWIDQIDDKTLPFEYKLLDYRPESWNPLKTAIFFMNMNQTLSFRTNTYGLTRLREAFGKNTIEALFPNLPEVLEPIVSKDTKWAHLNPSIPPSPADDFIPQVIQREFQIPEGNPGIGSNNWAVHGSRTASGSPLLASDPHLTLSLPSIWYEIQLSTPEFTVYGVTLPGVPGVIIGFNENISWAVTNTGGFAMDIFEVVLDETKTNYYHNGEWKPVTRREESYHIRGKSVVNEPIYFTHHGPIAYTSDEFPEQADSLRITTFSRSIPVGHAIQWVAHQPSNPLQAFYHLNRGKNFEDYERGVSLLSSPAQNFAFASVNGDIAMKISGRHPVRWEGQGKYISDGSNPAYDWIDYIPHDEVPWELNPQRGFVSSANQDLAGSDYPYFIGRGYASPARASIINRKLSVLTQATPQDMIALQMNSSNYWAEDWLDLMLSGLNDDLQSLSPFEYSILEHLHGWDRINHAESIEATVFNTWLAEIRRDMFVYEFEKLSGPIAAPSYLTTLRILFQQNDTHPFESLHGHKPDSRDILIRTFKKTVETLTKRHGEELSDKWQFWTINGSTINHLLDIPALNRPRLAVSGSSESPNAIGNQHGPSWRMVVEMGTPVKAWGIYPGGQTGNPASSGYDAFIDRWAAGDPFELTLHSSLESARSSMPGILKLTAN